MSKRFTITIEEEIEGETLEELQKGLAEAGYTGRTIRVHDVAGFTAGFVSANHWTAS